MIGRSQSPSVVVATVLAFAVFGVAGCYAVNVGHHDAGARDDAGAHDAGPCDCPPPPPGCIYVGSSCPCSAIDCGRSRCGRRICDEGTVCCNASCNTCAPPDVACSLVACPPDCSPQDARGEGACELHLGWAWDGRACSPLSGCVCQGVDCPHVFASLEECQSVFAACPAVGCEPDDARPVGACDAVLGARWTAFVCELISGCSCSGADCMEVVGRTLEECVRTHAGCPIAGP